MKASNPKPQSGSTPDSPSNPSKEATLDLKEIRKIIDLMKDNDLTLFHLEKDEFKIKLRRGPDNDVIYSQLPAASNPAPPPPPTSTTTPAQPAEAVPEGEEIASPMVGTFYRSPNPESPPFVEVGAAITPGQVICIIEAMKVMNEIKAERAGTLTAVLVDDASPVQFGQPLFRIK